MGGTSGIEAEGVGWRTFVYNRRGNMDGLQTKHEAYMMLGKQQRGEFGNKFLPTLPILGSHLGAVFSTFYSFIRLFANKRIEYEVGANKIWALFVDTDKGALIRLFDYSQLKTKQGETSNKTVPLRVFTCNDLCRISVEQ